MKKLQIVIALLITTTALSVNAQVVIKDKIPGKWKVSSMEAEGVKFDITDLEKLKASLYAQSEEEEPGKVITAEDSAAIDMAAGFLHSMFSKMTFDFRKDGTYSMKIVMEMFGEKKTETDEGTYKVVGNTVQMKDAKKKTETISIKMPDADTLVLSDFGSAKGMNIVLVRM